MGHSSVAKKKHAPTMRMGRPRSFAEAKAFVASQTVPRIRGYELIEEIGSGGMGVVYRARQRDLNRIVAVKMLRASSLTDDESRERFRAEAAAVARLQHPNIIQVFEIGEFEPMGAAGVTAPYIALEYVDGGSLLLRTDSPQSPRSAAEIVEKIARAVHSAHALGVIHRDLKPANVLLTRSGEPKIADFGLAKQLEAERDSAGRFLTQAGMVVGTPEYMPPEQMAGQSPATPAIDIYALGVILYEMLTARVPFRGATPFETMTIAQDSEPVSPRRLQPGLPRDLETICLKCLEKSPSRRYPSAEALADDLRRFLDGRSIQARRVGASEKATRWCLRNPLPATLFASIVATIVLAFALISSSNYRLEKTLENEAAATLEAKRVTKDERWERYRANITAAAGLFESHDVAAARAVRNAPEEHRGNWEWKHFESRIDLSSQTRDPGGLQDYRRLLTPDGATVYYMQKDVTLSMDVATGEVKRLRPILPWFIYAHVSGNGRVFLHRHGDHELEVWNAETGHALRFPHEGQNHDGKLDETGSRVLVGMPGRTLRIRDTSDGRLVLEFVPFENDEIGQTYFSPCGRRILAYGKTSRALRLFDAKDGKKIADLTCGSSGLLGSHFGKDRFITTEHFPESVMSLWDLETGRFVAKLEGHSNSIRSARYSPDGTRLATSSMDQTVRLWDTRNGRPLALMKGHGGWVNSVAFSPDGKRLASASQDHTVRIWDGRDGRPINVLSGHSEEVGHVAYTTDGESIVSVSFDGIVKKWDPKRLERNGQLTGHESFVYSVAAHPDGRHVASASWDGTARLWDVVEEREVARFQHPEKSIVLSVAIDPAGKRLYTRTREAVFSWDLETRTLRKRWEAPSDPWRHTRLALDTEGTLLATGGDGSVVLLYDLKTETLRTTLRGHRDSVRDVAFSPDGKRLASAGEVNDPRIFIWDVESGAEVRALEGHASVVYSLAFTPDGSTLASGGMDDTLRLWNTETWEPRATLKLGTHIYSIAFSPDGRRMATACSNNFIRLFDTERRQELLDLRGHTMYVHSVAFGPDGKRLFSASGDKSVRIWNSESPHK